MCKIREEAIRLERLYSASELRHYMNTYRDLYRFWRARIGGNKTPEKRSWAMAEMNHQRRQMSEMARALHLKLYGTTR